MNTRAFGNGKSHSRNSSKQRVDSQPKYARRDVKTRECDNEGPRACCGTTHARGPLPQRRNVALTLVETTQLLRRRTHTHGVSHFSPSYLFLVILRHTSVLRPSFCGTFAFSAGFSKFRRMSPNNRVCGSDNPCIPAPLSHDGRPLAAKNHCNTQSIWFSTLGLRVNSTPTHAHTFVTKRSDADIHSSMFDTNPSTFTFTPVPSPGQRCASRASLVFLLVPHTTTTWPGWWSDANRSATCMRWRQNQRRWW